MRRAVLLYTCVSDKKYNFLFFEFRVLQSLNCPPHPTITTVASNRKGLTPVIATFPAGEGYVGVRSPMEILKILNQSNSSVVSRS